MVNLETIAKEKLRNKIIEFCKSINKENFHKKYDPLIDEIMPYKALIKEKKEISDILSSIFETEILDENQEEVLMEVSNRFCTFCSLNHMIVW